MFLSVHLANKHASAHIEPDTELTLNKQFPKYPLIDHLSLCAGIHNRPPCSWWNPCHQWPVPGSSSSSGPQSLLTNSLWVSDIWPISPHTLRLRIGWSSLSWLLPDPGHLIASTCSSPTFLTALFRFSILGKERTLSWSEYHWFLFYCFYVQC